MQSQLIKNQKRHFSRGFLEDGINKTISVQIRFDDECGNGKNSFSITGEIRNPKAHYRNRVESCGCIHDDIKKHFPELAKYIPFHLMSADEGPMHYLANTLYFISDRDHNGLLKGEKRQIINGKSKLPAWHLVAVHKITGEEKQTYEIDRSFDSLEKPDCEYFLDYRPWCRIGEGKEIELDKAREASAWPEANIEDFTEENLKARLPMLLNNLKNAVEELGMIY